MEGVIEGFSYQTNTPSIQVSDVTRITADSQPTVRNRIAHRRSIQQWIQRWWSQTACTLTTLCQTDFPV